MNREQYIQTLNDHVQAGVADALRLGALRPEDTTNIDRLKQRLTAEFERDNGACPE